jgi:heme-degrading monooxygenase HmoA
MYAIVRSYSGAPELVDSLLEHEDEVKGLITGIDGFKAYYLVRTEDGEALSVSVYDDKAGADRSTTEAADWVRDNLPDLSVSRPQIIEGEVVLSA